MNNTEKAAAERDRKARIRRARERLAALPAEDQAAVVEAAEQKELAARDAGDRRAHVAFVEDALVAWEIGGRAIAARNAGKPLTEKQLAAMVQDVSREIRGDVGSPALREQALERAARPTAAAEVTIPAGASDAEIGTAARQLAENLVGDLRAKAVALRAKGLTVAEVATELGVNPALARDLCGGEKRGGAAKKQPAAGRKRAEREVRTHKGERQERCPECGEWKPAPVDAAGGYVKEADFRAGRGDCRGCYNRRWLEGKQRRESARAGK